MNSHSPQDFLHRPRAARPADQPEPRQFRAPNRVLASDSLFRGSYEIGIEHHGALYRLKITRQGKLILNK